MPGDITISDFNNFDISCLQTSKREELSIINKRHGLLYLVLLYLIHCVIVLVAPDMCRGCSLAVCARHVMCR